MHRGETHKRPRGVKSSDSAAEASHGVSMSAAAVNLVEHGRSSASPARAPVSCARHRSSRSVPWPVGVGSVSYVGSLPVDSLTTRLQAYHWDH